MTTFLNNLEWYIVLYVGFQSYNRSESQIFKITFWSAFLPHMGLSMMKMKWPIIIPYFCERIPEINVYSSQILFNWQMTSKWKQNINMRSAELPGSTKSTKEYYHRKMQCSQLSRTRQKIIIKEKLHAANQKWYNYKKWQKLNIIFHEICFQPRFESGFV